MPERVAAYGYTVEPLADGVRITYERAPLLGEHTGEILGELGLSRQDIDALHTRGVIGGEKSAA